MGLGVALKSGSARTSGRAFGKRPIVGAGFDGALEIKCDRYDGDKLFWIEKGNSKESLLRRCIAFRRGRVNVNADRIGELASARERRLSASTNPS
jgi:hypothetical protein